jgi:tetratricopeptide (TPR) repeat protein
MSTSTRPGSGTETPTGGDPAIEDTIDAGSIPGTGTGPGADTVETLETGAEAGASTRPGSQRARRSAVVEAQAFAGGAIGRFVLLGVLGSGGMGHVYSAYDPHLDRKVAIKLLRAAALRGGADDARARLLREAQAMAKINHPNVVKVHEVGTYEDQVYVAMEFADGGTLRTWLAGEHALPELLEVLVQAGRGLAAAHAVGLVHRDFKPDNVLLARDGSVRVTDFGLVGVTATPGTSLGPDTPRGPVPGAVPAALPAATPGAALDLARTLDLGAPESTPLSQDLTRTGAVMGTPAYMAPEQIVGTPATAATDQFAFCVVLHEALYGARPFPGNDLPEIAARVLAGQVPPPAKGARVPGWLRRVMLRGLSVDPGARYPSMDALLAELRRDRARRRRRILAWAASAAIPAAAAAAIALRPGAGAICDAGDNRAAAVWNDARRAQMKAAFLASGRPHAAASFDKLTEKLDAWRSSWALGYRDACRATRVRLEQSEHLLDLRMQCLTRRLADADATIALLAAGGGDAVDHALEAAMALPPLGPCADAAALTAAVAPPETDVVRAQVQAVRGRLDEARGRERLGRYAAALEAAREALAAARATGYRPVIAEALLVVGRNQIALVDRAGVAALRESMHAAVASGDTAGMIDAAASLVQALAVKGGNHELAQEVAALAEAAAIHARPPAWIDVRLQGSIGSLEKNRGRAAEARARYTAALALAEKELGPDHPATLATLTELGDVARLQGKYAEARTLLERVVAARERTAGKDHPDVASALNALGNVYVIEGKLDDARRLYDRALAIRVAALGPDHPAVGTSYNSLGSIYSAREDQVTAASYYARALALWEKAYGPGNVAIASAAANLAIALNAQGKHDQAIALYERVIALEEAAYGPEHPGLVGTLMNMGIARQAQRRLDEALALYQRADRIAEQVYGPDHPDVADTLGNIATVLDEQHKFGEARALTERSLRIAEHAYGADHPRVAMGLINLGSIQIEQGDFAGALASYQRSAPIIETRLGKDHLYLSYAQRGIAACLVKLHRADEAVPLLAQASRIRACAGAPPVFIEELLSGIPDLLAQDPRARAREAAAVKAAVAAYEKMGDATNAAKLRGWLDQHR